MTPLILSTRQWNRLLAACAVDPGNLPIDRAGKRTLPCRVVLAGDYETFQVKRAGRWKPFAMHTDKWDHLA